MNDTHPRLLEIIDYRLKSVLKNYNFHPFGRDLWILDKQNRNWFIIIDCYGSLKYNQKTLNNFFTLFSMKEKNFKPILKFWVEKNLKTPIREVQRINSDYSYLMETILDNKKKEKDWNLENRHGFSYNLVDKYVNLKKKFSGDELKMEKFFC